MALGHDHLGVRMTAENLGQKLISAQNPAFELFYTDPLLEKFQNTIGHKFADKSLLFRALTHKSFGHEKSVPDNEVLEFLGDAVLDLIVTQKLIELFPEQKEGELSKIRSAIVNKDTLAEVALKLDLDQVILVGKGEYSNAGHTRISNLSNALEAVIGAIFTEVGHQKCYDIVLSWFEQTHKNYFQYEVLQEVDLKGQLQELVYKKYQTMPKYHVTEVKADKQIQYQVRIEIAGQDVCQGSFDSKKRGMQQLAAVALNKLKQGEI